MQFGFSHHFGFMTDYGSVCERLLAGLRSPKHRQVPELVHRQQTE